MVAASSFTVLTIQPPAHVQQQW